MFVVFIYYSFYCISNGILTLLFLSLSAYARRGNERARLSACSCVRVCIFLFSVSFKAWTFLSDAII
jgi:hypothetical protein